MFVELFVEFILVLLTVMHLQQVTHSKVFTEHYVFTCSLGEYKTSVLGSSQSTKDGNYKCESKII